MKKERNSMKERASELAKNIKVLTEYSNTLTAEGNEQLASLIATNIKTMKEQLKSVKTIAEMMENGTFEGWL